MHVIVESLAKAKTILAGAARCEPWLKHGAVAGSAASPRGFRGRGRAPSMSPARRLFSCLAPAGGRALVHLAAAAAIAVLAPAFAPAAEEASGLFAVADPASGGMAVPAGDALMRQRLVTLDAGMLDRARATVRRGESATLALNLFEDAEFQALIESEAPTFSGGYSLSGRLAGQPLGSVTLVVNGDLVAGSVHTLEGTYSIDQVDEGLYAVSELDPSRLEEDLH